MTPHYPEEAIRELERCFDELGARFLKIYPDYFGKPSDDLAYYPIYEWCNERGVAIKSHALFPFDNPSVTILKRYAALAERYPRVTWILAHEGAGSTRGGVETAQRVPNTYLDTCGSGLTPGGVKYAVEGAGSDRVLFGSDMPLNDTRPQVAKVVTADIPDDAKRNVLGLNAMRLFGLDE